MTDDAHRWTLDSGTCSGEVLDDGAHVLRWQPAGRDPVLFARDDLTVVPGVPPRAGVPVCWPWFARGDDGRHEPSHGLARTTRWTRVDEDRDEHGGRVRHRLTGDDVDDPRWPAGCVLELTTRMGADLVLELTTTNDGDEPVELGEALHVYLAVGDVREVTVDGLDGAPCHDKVTGTDTVQHGPLRLTGETDRVYRSQAPVTVTDPVLRRRLVVETEGAANRVVWNPWQEQAAGLDGIGDRWPGLLCVEGATVADDGVVVPPGSSHTLTYRLTVEDL